MILIIYILFIALSLLVVQTKKRTSLFYLPIILVLIEIAAVFLTITSMDTGLNGIYFITLLIFSFFNIESKIETNSFKQLLIIVVFIALIVMSISPDISLINKISRAGNFILIILLIPLAIINGKYASKKLVIRNLVIASYIYSGYIILSSLLKYGPNHYSTDLIYGFMFEQWYFGALVVFIIPLHIMNSKYKGLNVIHLLVLFLSILLVLRRTVWIIIVSTLILTVIFGPKLLRQKKIVTLSVLIFFSSIIFLSQSAIWEIRGGRALSSSVENIENEARYLEYINTFIILYESNSWLFGTDYLFDETGRYDHPRETRPMHGAYARVIFGLGLVGLLIYLTILGYTLLLLLKKRKNNNLLLSVTIASLMTYLVVALTGASGIGLGASYTGTLFILCGYMISESEFKVMTVNSSNFYTPTFK